ncbi:hypothetical protein DBZ36_01695 [Alginatibacterium sediminis]|uniref:Transglutaminase domain-containing protein n=1 Tax=Alginatibacterium sediminis TaxID=2164068 RepID=A0A420EL84_9ALTE|nr:hypothetical protein DBZ36_01695 [Alginatibacterium sediminis]
MLLPLASSLVATSTQAQQLRFVRSTTDFEIVWIDQEQQRQSIAFELAGYPKQLSQFSAYKTENLNNFLLRELRKSPAAASNQQQQVTLTIKNNRLNYSIQAKDNQEVSQIYSELRALENDLFQQYLDINYWKVETSVSGSAIILPDYQRLISDSSPFMQSIGTAIVDKFPKTQNGVVTRDIVEFVLNFVQNIPYEHLSPVQRGAGYLSPIQTLRNNLGDCDSKSALMASIMRYVFPRLGIRMIYTKDHALLAFTLAAVGEDETINEDGRQLVLAEPTGPAALDFGQLAASTRSQIESGAYVSISIP